MRALEPLVRVHVQGKHWASVFVEIAQHVSVLHQQPAWCRRAPLHPAGAAGRPQNVRHPALYERQGHLHARHSGSGRQGHSLVEHGVHAKLILAQGTWSSMRTRPNLFLGSLPSSASSPSTQQWPCTSGEESLKCKHHGVEGQVRLCLCDVKCACTWQVLRSTLRIFSTSLLPGMVTQSPSNPTSRFARVISGHSGDLSDA